MFTWQLYTCLSSYIELYTIARSIVASTSSPFEAEDALRDWIRASVDAWFDQYPDDSFTVVITSLLQNALGQVDWAHLARAFVEL